MGREQLYKGIQKNYIILLIISIIGVVCSGFILLIFTGMIVGGGTSDGSDWVFVIAAGIIFILTLWALVVCIRTLKHPENSRAVKGFLKKNPDLFYQLDELFQNITYQDDFMILSPRIIANAKHLSQIAYTDEVFLVYVYTHSTNGIPDQKQLVLQTAREPINFNIYAKKSANVDALVDRIVQNCKYARVGFTDEGLEYANRMREIWKRDQESKRNNINEKV